MSPTCNVQHEYFSCYCFSTLTVVCQEHTTPCPQPSHSLKVLATQCANCAVLSEKQTASAAYGYLFRKRSEEAHAAVEEAHNDLRQLSHSRKAYALDPKTGKIYPSKATSRVDKLATPARRSSSRTSSPIPHGVKKGTYGPHTKSASEWQERATVSQAKLRADKVKQAERMARIARLSPERQDKVIAALVKGESCQCDVCGRTIADCLAGDEICVD